MTTIPNELNIKINTSIPGFSTINYTPNMTMPNINDKSVCFNPLVKLSQSVINSVPKDKRVTEFFNKGLFNSLINFHGSQKSISLKYAKDNGYINNNIKITLENLFPIGSVLYVNKEPYVIVDYQWIPGDWVVDTKINEAQLNYYNDLLYIQKGKEQLEELPIDLRVGENYVGPLPTKQLPVLPKAEVKPEITAEPKAEVKPEITAELKAEVKPEVKSEPKVEPMPTNASTEIVLSEPIVKTEHKITPVEISEDEKIINDYLSKNPSSVDIILNSLPESMFKTIQMDYTKRIQNIEEISKGTLIPNTNYDEVNTKMLQSFFVYKSYYYNLCNSIYKNLYDESGGKNIQKLLSDYLALTTSTYSSRVNINDNLSRKAYDRSVLQLKVYKNTYDKNTSDRSSLELVPYGSNSLSREVTHFDNITSNNDTFFLSIANILNRYNNLNSGKKITYDVPIGTLGTIDSFDNVTLRNIVIDGFKEFPFLIDEELKLAEGRVKNLNNLFKSEVVKLIVNNEFTEKNLHKIIFEIFNNNPNFFVILTPISITSFETFKIIHFDSNNAFDSGGRGLNLVNYILYNHYRIPNIINHILCIKLNINIFTITQGLNFEISGENCQLYYINKNKDNFTDECPNWKHFLFLYFNEKQNYYEEIRFEFNLPTSERPNTPTEISLFENINLTNNPNIIIPHFYIFFLYYASIYISLPEDYKNQNTFFKDVFKKMNDIFNTFYVQQQRLKNVIDTHKRLTENQKKLLTNLEQFFLYFTLLFPNQKVYLQKEYGIIQTQEQHPVNKTWLFKININENFKNMIGGRLSRYQQQNHEPQYRRQYQPQYRQQYQPQYRQQYQPQYRQQYQPQYLPQYQPQYLPQYHQSKTINSKNLSETSKLAFSVTIDIELRPGTKLTISELVNGTCNNRWNKIRKSYSVLTGKKYVIPPVYNFKYSKKNKTTNINNTGKKDKTKKNKITNNYNKKKYQNNRNYMPYKINNYTRKNNQSNNRYNKKFTKRR